MLASTRTVNMIKGQQRNKFQVSVRKLIIFSNFVVLTNLFTATGTSQRIYNSRRAANLQETQSIDATFHERRDDPPKPVNGLETNALIYLRRYGYMSRQSNLEANNLISEESFSSAVKDFQRFAGIPLTGVVDNRTLHFMRIPRCGNTDKPNKVKSGLRITASRQGSLLAANAIKRRRRKRYALQGSKWRRQVLTYRISQYPTRFNGKRHEVDSQIERAFGIWSQVAPIDFVVKKDGRVHIDIRFASGDHGDGDAFDGPGNTLAHAYFPQYGGDAHFDDQEYWTVDSYAGTNIFQVAAHELGHSLGLGHSNVREALMAPFYQKYKPNFKLHIDDVLAIQALYGEKPFLPEVPVQPALPTVSPAQTTTTPPPPPPPTTTTTVAPPTSFTRLQPPNWHKPSFFGPRRADGRETNDYDENSIADPSVLATNGIGGGSGNGDDAIGYPSSGTSYPADLCSDPVIEAITRTEDGNSYVFKGDYYWLLTAEGLAKGYPRRIAADWDNLPGSIDAALTWADGKTFFFKGNKYWRFRNKRRDVGYPKLISAGFAGIPDDIDAAFVWSGNGRTYIFKGDQYWRFDSKADPPVSGEYPRSIKVWNGVPAHINAAFKWENNVTYFFKGGQYYRFNDKDFKVESRGRPAFPRATPEWWFGCVGSNLAQRALPSRESVNQPRGLGESDIINAESAGNNHDIDWSFLAGLEQNTKVMGTHISDHSGRPPNPQNTNEEATTMAGLSLPSGGSLPSLPRHTPANTLPRQFGIDLFSSHQLSSSAIQISPLAQVNNMLIAILLYFALSYFSNVGRWRHER